MANNYCCGGMPGEPEKAPPAMLAVWLASSSAYDTRTMCPAVSAEGHTYVYGGLTEPEDVPLRFASGPGGFLHVCLSGMQAPVPSATTCNYDPICGGYPASILTTPLPPDFTCIVCQRIAREALTACKGLHTSRPNGPNPLAFWQRATCAAGAMRAASLHYPSSARAAGMRASASRPPTRQLAL